ncbi:MAG: tetratricopeptide repeat protein [Gemmataceae bacterium]|nr:tetratricopeptide repeat protein [Gemmata sp.]MDW8198410.1 tetratricopeptide repeat protein [Gemmataceae bacterium]
MWYWQLVGLFTLLGVLVVVEPTRGLYIPVETQNVPVERLTKNLEEAVKKNPKDVQAILNLARVHAMAYSLRSSEVPVDKKNPTTVWFGYEPPIVPFNQVAATDDPKKLQAAKEHLTKALQLYADAAKLQPDDLRIQLGYAWLLSQTEKKTEAIKALRDVIAKAWDKEKDLKALGLGGHTITAEGASYLIPLLDKEKDNEEIATLRQRIKKLNELPRPITPIAIPLQQGLTARDIEDRTACVTFDADGSGLRKNWTWIHPQAAWLVFDPKATGKVSSALQMFGNVTFWLFWETGYDALAALDDNCDGQLRGAELAGLALWHDANANGLCEPGEVKPLADYNIVALSCRYQRDPQHPDHIAFAAVGVTFADGTTRPSFDIVLHPAKKGTR